MENTTKQLPENRFSFTSTRIEKLQPRQKLYLNYDAEVSQLVIRVYPSGKKSFEVRTSHLGKPWSHKICDFNPVVSVAEVRKTAAQLLLRLQTGDDPKREKQERKECLTLREIFDWYAEDARTSGQKSFHQVDYLFKKYVEPSLGNRRLMTITTGDLSRLVRPLLEQGKRTQSNRVISFIARLYNFATRKHSYRGEVPTNHWTYEKERPSLKFMDEQTFLRFIEEVKREPDRDMRDLYLCLCYVGYRVTATNRMKFSDIDWEQNQWVIPSSSSKNNDDTVLDLCDKVMTILRERRQLRRGDDVFPKPKSGGPTAYRWRYRQAFDRICKRAGITGFYVHSIRKTVGGFMASKGKSMGEIAAQLGQKDIRAAMRSYSKIFDAKRKANANELANALP